MVLWPAVANAQPEAQEPGAPPREAGAPQAEQPPHAASARERARALVREGVELYERQGDRVGAVAKFEQAYEIYPAPEILFNLGLAYRDIGRNALAHRALSRFLSDLGFPDESRLRQAEEAVHELEPLVGRFLVVAPYRDGAAIVIDGETVGTAPMAHAVAAEPGVHEVTAVVAGKEVAYEQVTAAPGKLARVKLWRARGQVVPLPGATSPSSADSSLLAESPPASRPTPLYKRWWVWTAVGVVAAGAAIYVGTRGSTINDVDPSFGRFPFDEF